MNTFGRFFRLTTFGESHGTAIGGVVDGMPSNFPIDIDRIQMQLNRRRPGQSGIVTQRNEADEVKILSGIFEGRTLGSPIAFVIENSNQHSNDYEAMRHTFRPSHADYTYEAKYGIRDYRGGGRSSARETAARVVGGAFAREVLDKLGVSICAYTSQVGNVAVPYNYQDLDLSLTETNPVRCPNPESASKMEQLIAEVKGQGDTVGGVVTCVISGVPAGWGEPVFGKLHAELANAMMGINAAKGFELGMGFAGASKRGSEVVDNFIVNKNKHISTSTNNSGGIQGGISNGADILFRVAFKPVATLLQDVETVSDQGQPTTLRAHGRHDPCVVPRAVPIVEAMAAMVLLDAAMANNASHVLI